MATTRDERQHVLRPSRSHSPLAGLVGAHESPGINARVRSMYIVLEYVHVGSLFPTTCLANHDSSFKVSSYLYACP
jgi:hypothetical protein